MLEARIRGIEWMVRVDGEKLWLAPLVTQGEVIKSSLGVNIDRSERELSYTTVGLI